MTTPVATIPWAAAATTTPEAETPGQASARLAIALKAKAAELGFDACRISPPDAPEGVGSRLAEWLALGRHGEMAWMDNPRRAEPRALWSDVRACVMVGINYAPDGDPLAATAKPNHGAISVYARNRDYHDVLKGRLKQLASWLTARAGGDVKVFADTAPLMEKPLAQAAGLGWQGKHTNLVSRDFGSWLFLGALFVAVDLPADEAERDHCGTCRVCLDACPTRAFPAPYQLDARRCISYLTIEHKGPISWELREGIGNRVYGCDDCLAVCPWNKFARVGREAKLQAPDWRDPPLAELAELDDAAFRARFAGSPIKRIGRDRFVRNVLIAVGNSGDPDLVAAAWARLGDSSALVRGAAIWALSRLAPAEAAREARDDSDPDVREEWRRATQAFEHDVAVLK
jgi:epoxyqueuosine reductase